MLYEYSLAILFYAVFVVFGVIGLSFTSRWMVSFKTAYISAKPLGLLIFSYFIWFLSSFKLFDFQNTILLWIFLATGIGVSSSYLYKNWPKHWRNVFKDILWVEASWIILYLAYLWLRSHNAEIHGTERFMDMTFFSASYMTNYFPPIDPWRAGSPINYYYYGHYLFALVARFSGIATNFAYTYTLGVIFSSATLLSWAFVRRFTNSNFFASLAGFFTAVSGTVAFSFCVLEAQTPAICSWMKSTRLYEPSYIINEIPSYSFTVGDLHAHLIALPFFMLALIIIYDLFREPELRYDLMFALTIILASLGLVNPWDFISLAVVVFLAVLIKVLASKKTHRTLISALKNNYKFILKAAAIGVCAIILMLPFLLRFESGAQGIGFAPTYAKTNLLIGRQYPTPLHGWLGMWTGFLALAAVSIAAMRKKIFNAENYPVVLLSSAVLLLAGVELFFVKDVYSLANPPYFRANTVFKFGFHTWILLTFSAMVFAGQTWDEYRKSPARMRKIKPFIWLLMVSVAIVVFFGAYYPYQAINQFYLSSLPPYSLDGSLFLKKLYPDDYATVQWLKNNVRKREVVVEAAGDSYSDYGRLSVFTGSINPIQWLTHEWTWHFSPPKDAKPGMQVESGWGKVAAISGEVRQIYESPSAEQTKMLLEKYNAKYIYIGNLERKEYPGMQEQKFSELGELVFSSGNSRLYRIK
ncbi:MAG: YYY membrane protein [Candidatus Giovannonibacteria bacterium GW2011_GWA2_44_13b]|uniref:YYY membrane protein n=2 Tax=Candidatus Giovannoniibacteriota TaxID=1752738 RepID=A0A0G1K394_9BACT|nr:MAG: YYY membrane protein [Candidatus Giovannonibacteria bacterium GW2011_GWA2_44_13b]OGF83094.1 MAG: hypothetical protein A2924_03855 [Candidatus Giovannonibacteria bacterium RIFCSPLOWO2_01_FULL_44_16]